MSESLRLKVAHGRLKAFGSVNRNLAAVPPEVAIDFNSVIRSLAAEVGSDFAVYQLPMKNSTSYVQISIFTTKLEQALNHLELLVPSEDPTVEAGTLFNSIVDNELKLRVSDLLSAKAKFDRAINQATQVLEDRIRRKSRAPAGLTGTELVNRMIKADPAGSTLILSLDRSEQEGMANLCRGMMMAYRNETHHQLTDRYTRQDALKVCAFVDLLLRAVDDAVTAAAS